MIKLMAKRPQEKKQQIKAVMRELTSPKMMEQVQEWMELPQDKRLTMVCPFWLRLTARLTPLVARAPAWPFPR